MTGRPASPGRGKARAGAPAGRDDAAGGAEDELPVQGGPGQDEQVGQLVRPGRVGGTNGPPCRRRESGARRQEQGRAGAATAASCGGRGGLL